jgi:hypothetical protein
MKPHELLRQAALILADGWSHNTNARDHADRIVPLWVELLRQAALILHRRFNLGGNTIL